MPSLDVRTFDSADEALTDLELARAERVRLGDASVWRFTFEPGWRYTEHFEPQPCTAPHAGYIAQGRLHVQMEDGSSAEADPGSVVTIAPGHDAWTVGEEPCVLIDFAELVAR